jgi:hypothetical protein
MDYPPFSLDAGNGIRTRVTSFGTPVQQEKPAYIHASDLDNYFLLLEIEGICKDWQQNSRRWIKTYLEAVSWRIDEEKTLCFIRR